MGIFLAVLALFMGGMYLWMGFSICFLGRTGLISNFIADKLHGHLDDAYARRVGVIWLISGLTCTAAGVLALTITAPWAWLLPISGALGSLVAYRVHYRRSFQ